MRFCKIASLFQIIKRLRLCALDRFIAIFFLQWNE